jgi:RNA polymerase sigma factor (sigma-70 family)
LTERCIKGDRKAQFELYKLYVKPLYHAVIRLVPERTTAEEIVQDAFVSIFRHLPDYRSESSLFTWMRRIAVNKALDVIRKKKHEWALPDGKELADSLELDDRNEDELIDHLHEEIKKLPDGCREILSLYLFEGFKHIEIAQKLQITESTSKTQYLRARKLLALALTKYKVNEY